MKRRRRGAARCAESGKVRYRDEVAAGLALATLQRQDKDGHTEQRAYRCPACRGWHLTSKPKGQQ